MAAKIATQNLRPTPAKALKSFPLNVVDFLVRTFSRNGEKKDHARLITIPVSHYCEKVYIYFLFFEAPKKIADSKNR